MNVNDAAKATNPTTAEAPPTNALGKDEFMKLLVAQMSNQNPLEPLEGADFIAQLATFSNLEQLTGVNDGLDRLSAGQAGLLQGQTVGLVGRTAVFEGDSFEMGASGSTPVHYQLDRPADSVRIVLTNEAGEEFAYNGSPETGMQSVEITDLDPGRYSVRVEVAGDAEAKTFSTQRIAGVTYEDGLPKLIVGDDQIDPADIVRVLD